MVFLGKIRSSFARYQEKRCLEDLCTQEVFRALVEHERRRSDRTGDMFCVVSFHVPPGQAGKETLRKLYDVLRHRVRSTDAVGWFDQEHIGVLLVDTPVENAGRFVEDVLRRFGDTGEAPEYRVYAYPSDMLNYEEERYQDVHPLPKYAVPERHSGAEETDAVFCHPLEPRLGIGVPFWKRCFDLICAVVGLVVLAPLFVLVALWIKIVSPGPVFYKQTRVGFLGRPFKLWKFRTMKVGTDTSMHREYVSRLIRQEDQIMKKLDDRDPNIIPLGRFLRRSGIDELPQLINVLLGQMSLVGPRPSLPYEFREDLHWHKRRFYVLPGITGLWQVEGKDHVTFKEMIRADILYEQRRSLWMDIRILLKTFPAVWHLLMRTS